MKLAGDRVPAVQVSLPTEASKPGAQVVEQIAPEAITVPTLPLQPLPCMFVTLGKVQGVGLHKKVVGVSCSAKQLKEAMSGV